VKLSVQNEPEKFHEMGEPHVGHFHETFVSHCMYTVYKGKENELKGTSLGEKGKQNFELFCFLF
jgi:hypothetical protein